MSGSNIFLMYQDGSGNLTLSPRRGIGHVPPQLDTSGTPAQLTLLAGSGVSSDGTTMIANVRCSNCESWNGGQLSLTGSSSWIGAWKGGYSLATTNQNARIAQHDDTVVFELDSSRAAVSTDSNPFTAIGDGEANGEPGSGSGTGSDPNGGVNVVSSSRSNPTILAAHGVVMALVFAALYPLGSLLMPLLGKWWAHAAWQMVSFVLMWIGFGLGVSAAKGRNLVSNSQSRLAPQPADMGPPSSSTTPIPFLESSLSPCS